MQATPGAVKNLRLILATTLSLAVFSFAPDADARRERVRHIPNGNAFSCDSCHGRASLLPQDLTPFGRDADDAIQNGVVQWSQLYNMDSDGDGFTNGQELNDPNGNWRRGQADPGGATENPGIPQTYICGNGTLEPGEDCDGTNLFGETCETLGLGQGSLDCRRCQHFTFECGRCGDGILHADREDCDINDFGENSCASYGFLQGELVCNTDCTIDSTDCNSEAPAVCGDGVISRGELCDGTNFAGVNCERLNYAGGELLCDSECEWDADLCIPKDYSPIERPGHDVSDVSQDEDVVSGDGDSNDQNGPYNYDALRDNESDGCSTTSVGSSWLFLAVIGFFRRRRRDL